MATNNMHNLTTLIKRLEAATARLEDMASSTIELPQAVPALSQTLASQPSTPAPAPAPAPVSAPAAAAPAPVEELPESVEAFDAFVSNSVGKYVQLSSQIGGLVAEQASKVFEGFSEQRMFLLISTKAKKPDLSGADMSAYQNMLKPMEEAIMAAGAIKDSNRGDPAFDNLSCVAEGIMVLAWVTIDSRPWKHVEEALGSAQYWGNRVLKAHKDKDPQHVEWVQAFYQIFKDLAELSREYFSNGMNWNPKGPSIQEVLKSVSNAAAPSAAAAPPPPPPPAAGGAGAPPPPPPPGPPPVLQIKESAPAPAAGGLGAVFSELNQGEAVTAGLRKVDKSQMTHKNPSLRASSTVPNREGPSSPHSKSSAPGKKPKPESMRVKKPAKKELDGNKWTIENYEKEDAPIVIDASISHSILISKCSATTIIVKGKANAVTIENSNRLSLVVDSLVSTVDVVKSANFALQVMGSIPTVMMDQIDGATIYLSRESTSTRIFSSKSSGINLNVISGPDDEDYDYKEVPLPYQICSYYDENKGELVSEIVDHAG